MKNGTYFPLIKAHSLSVIKRTMIINCLSTAYQETTILVVGSPHLTPMQRDLKTHPYGNKICEIVFMKNCLCVSTRTMQ